MRHVNALALLVILATPQLAQAQPLPSGGNHAVVWTAVGAGGGFGVGLVAGLAAFDDAINSDRKVWTSAIVGAAVGGTLGYLIGRHHRRGAGSTTASSPRRSARPPQRLADRDVQRLAASLRLDKLQHRAH